MLSYFILVLKGQKSKSSFLFPLENPCFAVGLWSKVFKGQKFRHFFGGIYMTSCLFEFR